MATTLGAQAGAKAKAGRPPSSHHTRGRRGGAVRCLAYQKYEDVRGRRRGGRESGTSGGDGTETGRWLSVAGPSGSSSTSSSKVSDDGDGFGERLEDRYDVGRTVGKGGYGVVREAFCKSTGKIVAVKTVQKRPRHFTGRASLYRIKVQTEFRAHLSLGKSLDVAYAYEAFEDAASVHLVLELCSGGTLLTSSYLAGEERGGDGGYTERRVASVLRSALRSVVQCHLHGIVYRDVKPENFLWTEKGHLKLTDFGLAAFCKEDERLAERCGTVSFLAPEVIKQDYAHECDVWGVGVMAYLLLTGRYPFRDEEGQQQTAKEVWRAVLYEEPDFETDPWPRISVEAKDLVSSLLVKDPSGRISAREALSHPWLAAEGERDAGGLLEDEPALEESLVCRLQRFGLYSKLKQALLQKAVVHMNLLERQDEEVKSVTSFLDSLDYSKSGTVRVDDLVWMLSSGGYDLETEEWTQICEQIDADSHDTLRVRDLAPMLVDWPKVQGKDTWRAWVEDMFSSISKTCDVITLDRLAELVCEPDLDGACSLEMVDEIARVLGSGGDKAGRIDLEEFANLLEARDSELLSYYDSRVETYYGGGDAAGVED